jgi:hypothetical protein
VRPPQFYGCVRHFAPRQGGAEYSLIRQSKETLAQQRLVLEQTRDQTRANTVTAWGHDRVGDRAQRRARRGESRTTNHARRATQQALVDARVALVTAQHERVVASYSVLSAVDRALLTRADRRRAGNAALIGTIDPAPKDYRRSISQIRHHDAVGYQLGHAFACVDPIRRRPAWEV